MKFKATVAVVGKIMANETCGIPKILIRIRHWSWGPLKWLLLKISPRAGKETSRRINLVIERHCDIRWTWRRQSGFQSTYKGRPQSKFPTRPTVYCVKLLHVHDRLMTSDDACSSGTSLFLTVASLQRLKMEALIPSSTDCEVRSVIKFLNAQRISPIILHRQLC